jgi:hypothetical protein
MEGKREKKGNTAQIAREGIAKTETFSKSSSFANE